MVNTLANCCVEEHLYSTTSAQLRSSDMTLLHAPLVNRAQEFRFLVAVLATQNKQWPDKWEAIVSYVGVEGLTAARALVIAQEMLLDSPELETVFNDCGLTQARLEICGGVHIYPHDTCPTCFLATGETQSGSLTPCKEAVRAKTCNGRPIVGYLDNGGSRRCTTYVRTCRTCGTRVFPFHREVAGKPGSKLAFPLQFEDKYFDQFGEQTIISKQIVERFRSNVALACPTPFSSTTQIRHRISKKCQESDAVDEEALTALEYMAASEYGPVPHVCDERDMLDQKRLSEAVIWSEMKDFVQMHGTSLLTLFDWGSMSEFDCYELCKDGMWQVLRGNFVTHMAAGRAKGLPTLCGDYMSYDGLCQTVRDHCSFVIGPDPSHPFDRHAVLCPHSLTRLKNKKFSRFCREHLPLTDVAEDITDDLAEPGEVRAASAAYSTLDPEVMSSKARAREKSIFVAYNKVATILVQIRNQVVGSNEKMFLVAWEGQDLGNCTREPYRVLKDTDAMKAWELLNGNDLQQYDLQYELDSEGRAHMHDIAMATTYRVFQAEAAARAASVSRGATAVPPAGTAPVEPVPPVGAAPVAPLSAGASSSTAPSIVGLSIVEVTKELLCLSCNPADPAGVITLAVDSEPRTGVECAEKIFEKGTDVANSKMSKKSMVTSVKSARGKSNQLNDDDDAEDRGRETETGHKGNKRKTTDESHVEHTTGTLHACCTCGYPAPGIEMLRHESCTMCMEYIKRLLGNESRWPRFMGYDYMCGLAKFALNRVTKSPVMMKFVKEVIKVVDKFHFGGHKVRGYVLKVLEGLVESA